MNYSNPINLHPFHLPCTYKTIVCSLFYLLALGFFTANNLEAKPDSKPKADQVPTTKEDPKQKPQTDESLKQIQESWLKEMEGQSNTNENSTESRSDSTTTKKSDSESLTRFNNPGQNNSTTTASSEAGEGLFAAQEGPSFFSVILRFLGMMVLLLGALYGAMRLAKRRGGRLFAQDSSGLVEVLLSVPLVQGKFIQIVDIAGQLMVLGVSDAGVQMISEIRDRESRDLIRLWQSQNEGPVMPEGMMSQLNQFLARLDLNFWPTKKSSSDQKAFGTVLADITNRFTGPKQKQTSAEPEQAMLFEDDQKAVDEISEMLSRHGQNLKSKSRPKNRSK